MKMNYLKFKIYTALIVFLEFILNSKKIIKILDLLKCNFKCSRFNRVSFIMDGNRRYCRMTRIDQTKAVGLSRMVDVIEFCYEMKIKNIDFFALSVKNMKRRDDGEKLDELSQNLRSKIKKYMKFVLIGNLSLIEESIATKLRKIEEETKNNKGILINVFVAFSAEWKCYEKSDVLIRTGDTKRFSDFMLFSAANGAHINFLRCHWPEITKWHIFLIYLKFLIEKRLLNLNAINI